MSTRLGADLIATEVGDGKCQQLHMVIASAAEPSYLHLVTQVHPAMSIEPGSDVGALVLLFGK